MKKFFLAITVLLAMLFTVGCHAVKLTPNEQMFVGHNQIVYTQVGMWADRGVKVFGTNYRRGLFIPVNSSVTIKSINGSIIKFKYNSNMLYIVNVRKYTKVNINQLLDRTFAIKKVTLSKFNKVTKRNILNGDIKVGMSKDAVILARGYPPAHKTPSLQDNEWRYWVSRFNTTVYQFKNNKVSKIIK